MLISAVRHNRREPDGFQHIQSRGNRSFSLFFFQTPVDLRLQDNALSLQPGSCIFYAPGAVQHITSRGPLRYSRLDAIEDIAPMLLQFHLPVGQPFYIPNAEAVSEVFLQINQEFHSKNPYREEMLLSYLQVLLILLARSEDSTAPGIRLQQDLHLDIHNIRQHVLSNPQRKWTVTEMAQMMSLSPSRFHAIYKEVFGSAPMRDVIESKIRYAKNLLLDSKNFSMPQIADMLGYNDQYHFIRQFRTETGVTPGVYRKTHR